jgi:hypothetical protein
MAGKLKPLDVDRETRPGKYADGDGLYLIVTGATSKNWSYRWQAGLAWAHSRTCHSRMPCGASLRSSALNSRKYARRRSRRIDLPEP